MNITIIGFGEAGPVFGQVLRDAGMKITAFDKLQLDSSKRQQQIEKTHALGITAAESITDAVSQADLVISTVTASQAIHAATEAAAGLQANTHWLDLNSVAPKTKAIIASIVKKRGVTFTEAVAMDTVPAFGAKVPILACGPNASIWVERLNAAGLNMRVVSDQLGKASTTKLIRSVLIKGFESLFAEAIEAAGKENVQEDVMSSLEASYPGLDWRELAGYQLSRSSIHASRRASEMREAAALLEDLRVAPVMTAATVAKQQQLADRAVGVNYQGNSIEDFLRAIASCNNA